MECFCEQRAIIDPLCLVFKVSGTHFLFGYASDVKSFIKFFLIKEGSANETYKLQENRGEMLDNENEHGGYSGLRTVL